MNVRRATSGHVAVCNPVEINEVLNKNIDVLKGEGYILGGRG